MNKLTKIILISLVFTVLLLGFFVFAKVAIDNYNYQIQEYAPQLALLQMQAANEEADLNEIEKVSGEVDEIANKALFFIFILIPLIPFLLWIFLEGMVWKLIVHNNLKNFKRFLKDFSILSFFGFLISYLVLYNLFKEDNLLLISFGKVMVSFVVLILLFYFLILTYCALKKYRWKEAVKHGFKLSKKKFVPGFFVYLGFAVVAIAYSLLFMFLYVQLLASVNTGTLSFELWLPATLIIMVILCSLVRIKLFDLVKDAI